MKLTTHLSTQWGWKAELALLADLQRMVYPYKWLPISCRSGADQWKWSLLTVLTSWIQDFCRHWLWVRGRCVDQSQPHCMQQHTHTHTRVKLESTHRVQTSTNAGKCWKCPISQFEKWKTGWQRSVCKRGVSHPFPSNSCTLLPSFSPITGAQPTKSNRGSGKCSGFRHSPTTECFMVCILSWKIMFLVWLICVTTDILNWHCMQISKISTGFTDSLVKKSWVS